jgi:hypothetical protein
MRRTTTFAGAVALLAILTGCTGRGGGWLPPSAVFREQATFGLSFTCESERLHLELSYTEHGPVSFGPGPFDVHGTADTIPADLESALCAGETPPPGGQELVILGQFRVTSGERFPARCLTDPACRFQVTIRDNDADRQPSAGDFFEILLSGSTVLGDILPETILYSRSGILAGGNVTVS